MKTKLFLLLTAAMLLLSVNVSAQTKKAAEKKAVKTEKRATAKKAPAGTPLKGDVNEDGVVDVADIAAVIAIMKNGGGTGEETKYYWYVGTTDPSTMSSVSSVVNDTTSPGWRLIGTTVPTYTMQSPLWNGQVNEIVFDSYRDITAYIALPNANIKVRDGLGNDVTSKMVSKGTKEISGVTYTIYQNSSNVMSYSLDLLVY